MSLHRRLWCAGKLEAKSCRSVGIALMEAISELAPGLQAAGMRPSKSSKVNTVAAHAAPLPSSQADSCHLHSVQHRPVGGLGVHTGLLLHRLPSALPSLAAPVNNYLIR